MNLIRHLCGVLYVDKELFSKPYPEVLLPISDNATIIQYAVYSLALVGCRTIWIISDADYPFYVKERVGEYIPDPIAYKKGVDISQHLIPIYYMNLYFKGDKKHYEVDYFMNIRKLLTSTAKAVSHYLTPDKWFFTRVNYLYPINELSTMKLEVLEDNNEFLELQNSDGKNVGHIIPHKDALLLRRIYTNSNPKTLEELVTGYPKTKKFIFDTKILTDFESYKNILQDKNISSFKYPEVFDKYKTRQTYGLDQPFIAKDTKITIRRK